jgi:hypothetical protein
MFSYAVLALVLASRVTGITLPREAPSEGWMADYFEVFSNPIYLF